MPEYDNTNQFAFFLQEGDNKKSENSPDYKSNGKYALTLGDDLVEYIKNGGRDLEISGWKRVSGNGTKFVSCQVQAPWAKEQQEEIDF